MLKSPRMYVSLTAVSTESHDEVGHSCLFGFPIEEQIPQVQIRKFL